MDAGITKHQDMVDIKAAVGAQVGKRQLNRKKTVSLLHVAFWQ